MSINNQFYREYIQDDDKNDDIVSVIKEVIEEKRVATFERIKFDKLKTLAEINKQRLMLCLELEAGLDIPIDNLFHAEIVNDCKLSNDADTGEQVLYWGDAKVGVFKEDIGFVDAIVGLRKDVNNPHLKEGACGT